MNEYLKKNVLLLILCCPAFSMTELFVSTQGHDANPGTEARPFATLQRARDAVRALKQQSGRAWQGATVWVEPGTYCLSETLQLARQDSGTETAPVVYRARPGQEVRLVGGKSVTNFGPVTEASVLNRLPDTARTHVLCADLKAQGMTDFGEVAAQGKRLECFFEDKAMQLARWPNEGFVRVVDVTGETPMTTHGIKGTREGKFIYAEDRPGAWSAEPDVWLHGYWFWDWSDAFERVSHIDPVDKIISTTPPYHNYGYRKGQRYYALNVLAELDRPGEWYLDRDKGILYVWPPRDVPDVTVVLSKLSSLFAFKDCSWVTLRGFVLEATRSTAITLSGGRANQVQGCTIRNTGAWAVRVSGGQQHAVLGCDIYDTGEGGVSLSGGDRTTLTPAGHLAENNHIHHFGRIYRTYRPGVSVGGVGNRVRHNVIHDGPHNAIQLGGNDHLIAFNEIHHVCYETGDVGAFYMGRDWTARGTMIRHNYFHHIQGPGLHGAMAVYLDDSASGISIVGNLFHKAGRAAFIGGGRDNLVDNNVFVDCPASVHVDARGVGWMKYHVDEGGTLPTRLEAMPYETSPWKEKYPQLLTLTEDDPGLPKGNVVRHNISYGGKWLDVESKAMPLIQFEDNFVDKDPCFVNIEQGDFRLQPESPALALGFEPIPIEKIGLFAHEFRVSPVERSEENTCGQGLSVQGVTVTPHLQSRDMRYRKATDFSLGARTQLFIQNRSSSSMTLKADTDIRLRGRTPKDLLEADEWAWYDFSDAWEEPLTLASEALTVWAWNGKREAWGVGTQADVRISLPGKDTEAQACQISLAQPKVWLSSMTCLGQKDTPFPDRLIFHVANQADTALHVEGCRLWLPKDNGTWRALFAGKWHTDLKTFPVNGVIPPNDRGGAIVDTGTLPLTYCALEVRLRDAKDTPVTVWAHVRIKREVFDISGGWVSSKAKEGSTLTHEAFLKTLKRMHLNTAHIGEVRGYTDNPDLYAQYPLKRFNKLADIDRYDTDAMLPQIHGVEFLGEPQYGGGRPVPPMEVWRKLTPYQGTRLATTVTHSEERIWRFYAGLSDYPHYDAYRVCAPAADSWRMYDRWSDERIRWGAPLEGIGIMTRSLRELNRPASIAYWSQGAHNGWRGYGRRSSPTSQELRAQAYHALAARITSLYWFNLSLESILKFPDLIEPITQVGREIRLLEDYYLEGDATHYERVNRAGRPDWDVSVVAGPQGAVLFALDLDYQADLEEKVFRFKAPRQAVIEFDLPAYMRNPATVLRVNAHHVTPVPFDVTPGGIRIQAEFGDVNVFVASQRTDTQETLEARRKALVALEESFGFDPAHNRADLEQLRSIVKK